MDDRFTKVRKFFNYSKGQQVGILILFLLIIALQIFIFCFDFDKFLEEEKTDAEWIAYQSKLDSLKIGNNYKKSVIYPFNPNFITDFKGYKLGMKTEEIDRLLHFRNQNKYVNSAEEFQQVTKVSDSLLKVISPYFKFPDWVKNKKQFQNGFKNYDNKTSAITVLDINKATKEDLKKIYGIGDGLSERILKQKELYGGFVSMEQMQDVWGLSPEVIESLNKYFKVIEIPNVKKININEASLKDLSQFPYFRYYLAKEIVTYRSMNGDIKPNDLASIKGFPIEKIKIITLYLDF